MLSDRYPSEAVFARVPELADQTDPVLIQLDHLLDDDVLYHQQVRHDLAQRPRLLPVHGRPSTPADVLLRLLVVQHLSAWSYQETVDWVADWLVLRWCCRVYFHRVADKTTLLRWAQTIRPETLHALTDRAARLAQHAQVTRARKLRLDSTCVQTTSHHPTDSSLLGDGVRVLTRLIHQAKPLVPEQVIGVRGAFRNRLRSVRRLVRQIHRTSRLRGDEATAHQRALYARLLETTRQTVRQAERVQAALTAYLNCCARLGLPLGRPAQEPAQFMDNGFEACGCHSAPHLLEDHRPRRQIVEQQAPVETGLDQVTQPVEDLTQLMLALADIFRQ